MRSRKTYFSHSNHDCRKNNLFYLKSPEKEDKDE